MTMMVNGNGFCLSRWFGQADDISSDSVLDQHQREGILNQLNDFLEWASQDKGADILVRVPTGQVRITTKKEEGLCHFLMVLDDSWVSFKFWMNISSMKDLGEKLRANLDKKVDYEALMIGL